MSSFLDQLSPVQREAAENFQGPSIIVAGAGSGKTRVLTYRIAHMLEQGVPPYHILALTFTNKAAREMKERIGRIVSEPRARSLWMGTFHSVFARILRVEAERLGYPPSFTIYDTADSRNVVKLILKEMNLSDETYKPNEISSRISLAKNNLVTAAAYESNAVLVAEDRERRRPQFAEVYKRYVQKCRENGAMDFDDLLLNMNLLFRDHPDALEKYQRQFQYVLVDEYQDTNMAQYLIVKKIAERHHNICVVGDDAQSIYSFRGAKIENILRFQKDYPEARMFKLEQNYRSTQTIVNAANSIIEKNRRQLKKKSFSANDEGEKIRVFRAYTDQEEGLIVSNDIFRLTRSKQVACNDIAILYRTNAQSRVLEDNLRHRNIPYKIYGGVPFYQRKEIKDVLAYIRLTVNHKDDEALRRIINYPARGIGDVTVGKIADTAESRGISMWEAISTLSPDQMGLNAGAAKKLAEFREMIVELSEAVHTMPAYDLGLKVAMRSGILGFFKMQNSFEASSVVDNIEELLNSIASFVEMESRNNPDGTPPTIDVWLQYVPLLTDADSEGEENRNHVTLMTIHQAKGLEYDYVYITGLEDFLFPSRSCFESMEAMEEERRLFYVALTRAKTDVILSFAQSRFLWGKTVSNPPSRFIEEIDGAYLDPQFVENQDHSYASDERPAERPFRNFRQTESPVPRREFSPRPDPQTMRSMGRRLVSEPDPAERTAAAPSSAGPVAVGCRVEHEKFGRGTVAALEETGNGAKATVTFDGAGEKTLLLKYARLRVL